MKKGFKGKKGLVDNVKAEYLKKGYSAAKAQSIGGAVAEKKKKFGSAAMKDC